jgi:hypothetical protein
VRSRGGDRQRHTARSFVIRAMPGFYTNVKAFARTAARRIHKRRESSMCCPPRLRSRRTCPPRRRRARARAGSAHRPATGDAGAFTAASRQRASAELRAAGPSMVEASERPRPEAAKDSHFEAPACGVIEFRRRL